MTFPLTLVTLACLAVLEALALEGSTARGHIGSDGQYFPQVIIRWIQTPSAQR